MRRSTAVAFAAGVLVCWAIASAVDRWEKRPGHLLSVKEFVVEDEFTGERLNASVGAMSMEGGQSYQLLTEMPLGGPYRVTTADKAMARIRVSAEGYQSTEVSLDPYSHVQSGGRIKIDTIKLKRTSNNTSEGIRQPADGLPEPSM